MAPDDRVLVTSLEDQTRLAEWAAALTAGALVGIGTPEQVRAGRRVCAAYDNVMFVEGSRQEIPWQEGWFSLILDPCPGEPTAEMNRVLMPGGLIGSISA